jgi:hypothetical protein
LAEPDGEWIVALLEPDVTCAEGNLLGEMSQRVR